MTVIEVGSGSGVEPPSCCPCLLQPSPMAADSSARAPLPGVAPHSAMVTLTAATVKVLWKDCEDAHGEV